MKMKELDYIIKTLKNQGNADNLAGMVRYGIKVDEAFGVKIPVLRNLAKSYKKQHLLALELFKTNWHELKILASMIDDPKELRAEQMEEWALGFDSWDVVDQCVMNLFEKRHDLAYPKAYEWLGREEEFVKRAALVIMARLAFTDRKAEDSKILAFLPFLLQHAYDERNFVKKANNWALRQIGKRNLTCRAHALETAEKMLESDNKHAVWIARDAIRELNDPKIVSRLK